MIAIQIPSVNRSSEMESKATPERDDKELTVDQWVAIRKEAGLGIDPVTAEVDWEFGDVLDHRVHPDARAGCIGRIYFARSPGSDIWVCFYDLPKKAREELWDRIDKGLARFREFDLDFLE
jgi:hypothetical protein